jgi:hypothetical protein
MNDSRMDSGDPGQSILQCLGDPGNPNGLDTALKSLSRSTKKITFKFWRNAFETAHGIQTHDVRDRCLSSLAQYVDLETQRLLLWKVMSDAHESIGEKTQKTPSQYKVAEDLLQRRPDLLAMKRSDATVFHDAVRTEAHEFLKRMLEKLKTKVPQETLKSAAEETNNLGKTALTVAVEGRNPVIVQALLDHIETLDFTSEQVEYVVSQGPPVWIDIISVVAEKRPKSISEEIVFHAIQKDKGDLIEILVLARFEFFRHRGLLHKAVQVGKPSAVKHLLRICPEFALEKFSLEQREKSGEEKHPALFYNDSKNVSPEVKRDIRQMMLPVIVRHTGSETIRDLLADKGTCRRRLNPVSANEANQAIVSRREQESPKHDETSADLT